jgi:hypothetical protein
MVCPAVAYVGASPCRVSSRGWTFRVVTDAAGPQAFRPEKVRRLICSKARKHQHERGLLENALLTKKTRARTVLLTTPSRQEPPMSTVSIERSISQLSSTPLDPVRDHLRHFSNQSPATILVQLECAQWELDHLALPDGFRFIGQRMIDGVRHACHIMHPDHIEDAT